MTVKLFQFFGKVKQRKEVEEKDVFVVSDSEANALNEIKGFVTDAQFIKTFDLGSGWK